MSATDTHQGARCAGGCGRPLGAGRCFCEPCTALIACSRPLSRPADTPQWRAPGWELRRPEEVTTVAYA